jgi:hypothetical protein
MGKQSVEETLVRDCFEADFGADSGRVTDRDPDARPALPVRACSDKLRHRRSPIGSSLIVTVLTRLIFVKVFDAVLENQKVGAILTMKLDAALVIPLDGSVDYFTILENDDHRSFGIHLLLVIEGLGVGLLRWDLLLRLWRLLWCLSLSLAARAEPVGLRSWSCCSLSLTSASVVRISFLFKFSSST